MLVALVLCLRQHVYRWKIKNDIVIKISKKANSKMECDLIKDINNIHIIKTYECFVKNNIYFSILEYCNAGSLKTYIRATYPKGLLNHYKNNIKMAFNIATFIMLQIMNGLRVLYDNKIMHRDIKLDNILVNITENKFVLKLIDFGLSVRYNSIDNMISNKSGTLLYMSPQLINKQKSTIKADIWSFGIMYIELLCSHKDISIIVNQIRHGFGIEKIFDNIFKLYGIDIKHIDVPAISDIIYIIAKCTLHDETDRVSWSNLFVLMYDLKNKYKLYKAEHELMKQQTSSYDISEMFEL